MRRSPKPLLTLLAFLAAGIVLAPRAYAESSPVPVAIRPTRMEFAANPGETLHDTLYFWNGTSTWLPVALEAADFAPTDEEGHVEVGGPEENVNSLKAWVRPAVPQLEVAPQQEIALDFAINVPANADPGTHWGTLLVATAPVSASGGGAIIRSRLGLIMLVRVAGETREKLTLDSLSAPRFLQEPPLGLAARFRNEGTVHEAPSGEIEVRDMFGWLVATSTLPVRNVLPGLVRKVEAQVGDGLWFGRYTVFLHATYGDGSQRLETTRTIWVIPWRTQGWKVLLAILFIAFVIWKRRNFGSAWYFLRTGSPPPQDL